jgi:Fe-S-cluster containining protein
VELQPDVDRVPESLVAVYSGVRFMDQRGDGACVALDPVTRLCTIYDLRPAVCRQFDRGSSLCRSVLISPDAVRRLVADLPVPA